MAANDELFRIILETVGTEGLDEFRKALDLNKAAIGDLKDAYDRGEIGQGDYLKGVDELARACAKLETTIKGLERAQRAEGEATASAKPHVYELADTYELVEDHAEQAAHAVQSLGAAQRAVATAGPGQVQIARNVVISLREEGEAAERTAAQIAGLGRASGRGGSLGMGLLQASQFLDDLQYGLRGVVNNVAPLVTSLGLGMGLAGVIQVVMIGVSQLVNRWEDIQKLWQSEATQKEAERMKLLGDETKKTADEADRLRKMQGKDVDEQKGRVEQAVKEVGFPQARDDVAEAIRRSGRGGTDEMNKKNAEDLIARATRGDRAALDALFGYAGVDASGMLPGSNAGAFGKALDDPGGQRQARADQLKAQASARAREAAARHEADEKKRSEKAVEDAEQEAEEGVAGIERAEQADARKAEADAKRKAAADDREREQAGRRQAQEERRLGGPEAVAIRDQLAGVIGRGTGSGLEDAQRGAEEAMRLAMQEGIDLQSATLAVMQQMAAQQQAQRQALARMRGQLGGIQGQMRAGQPQAPGSWAPFAFWQ